jgi:uncharacterized protein (TIGR00295 family)
MFFDFEKRFLVTDACNQGEKMVPDRLEALRIHSEFGSKAEIVQHCEAVAQIASELAERYRSKGLEVDSKIVFAAALLHDIGRTKTHGVNHGIVGADLVRKKNVDEKIAQIISRHVGAGISKEEAKKFGFPEGDYIPRTREERIVCFSDKVVGPHGRVVPFQIEVEKFTKKGLDAERLENLKKSIESELGQDPETGLSDVKVSGRL